MSKTEDLEKLTDEELDELLPVGMDIVDYTQDYTKTAKENDEIIRQRKIKAILNK